MADLLLMLWSKVRAWPPNIIPRRRAGAHLWLRRMLAVLEWNSAITDGRRSGWRDFHVLVTRLILEMLRYIVLHGHLIFDCCIVYIFIVIFIYATFATKICRSFMFVCFTILAFVSLSSSSVSRPSTHISVPANRFLYVARRKFVKLFIVTKYDHCDID